MSRGRKQRGASPATLSPPAAAPLRRLTTAAGAEWRFRSFLAALHRAGRRRWLYPLLSAALGSAIILALVAAGGLPQPTVHDEFSYLLGADTFASGRLANPPHPLWPFFETIHVLSQPSYATKYQPGHSLALALGQVVFGHPFYGVVLENALLFAALCAMLQAWLSPGWALLGSVFSILSLAGGHYWSVSYWGGSLAAAGGALLLASYPRLTGSSAARHAWLAGVAIVLLFWTRPFEGGLLVAALSAHAFFRLRRPSLLRPPSWKQAVPLAVCLLFGLGFQALYNRAVTGNLFELPYMEAARQYHVTPVLWPASMAPPKSYRLDVLRAQFTEWEPQIYNQIQGMNVPQRLLFLLDRLSDTLHATAPLAFILPVAFLFWRQRSVRLLLGLAGVGLLGLSLETWLYPHYLAPWFPLALLLAFLVLRNLVNVSWRGPRGGFALAVMLLLTAFGAAGLRTAVQMRYYLHRESAAFNVGWERQRLGRHLNRIDPAHQPLVVVRYSPRHDVKQEWVYNQARIDDSPIVWAHDLGDAENRRLLRYFPSRAAWLFEPDRNPPALKPYSPDSPTGLPR